MRNARALARIGTLAFAMVSAAALPASAQIDITGNYEPIMHEDQVERIPGPDVGDYAGLPITEAARFRANSWSPSLLTLPEHQCKPHPSTYGFRGVGNLRIQSVVDPESEEIVAYTTHIRWMEQKRTIWMDGRPHPPEFAPHTWQGFSTGRWEGNVLVVETTHLKAGWFRRNGLMLTDAAKMTERFIKHGNVIQHVYMIEDPNYLTEPLIKTSGFLLQDRDYMEPYPCSYVTEVPRARGEVPHNLPGTEASNPSAEYAAMHKIPVEAARGGAETAYPEFMRRAQPAAGRTGAQ